MGSCITICSTWTNRVWLRPPGGSFTLIGRLLRSKSTLQDPLSCGVVSCNLHGRPIRADFGRLACRVSVVRERHAEIVCMLRASGCHSLAVPAAVKTRSRVDLHPGKSGNHSTCSVMGYNQGLCAADGFVWYPGFRFICSEIAELAGP